MKSTLLLLVLLVGLAQAECSTAAPVQDLDRINDLVNQARNLAESARIESPQSRGIGAGLQSQSQLKNPFTQNAYAHGVEVQSANGPRVSIGGEKIGIDVAGQLIEIPRAGEYYAPNRVDPTMSLPARTVARNPRTTVSHAMETAGNYRMLGDAVRAFREADFPLALSTIQRVKPDYTNGMFIQFQSLCLFASGEYSKSAEFAYAAASRSQIYSWDQLRGYYGIPELYVEQYRKLEADVATQDSNPSLRFLLGYHHLMLGHRKQASREFEFVLSKLPKDPVVQRLLIIARHEPPMPGQ